MSWRERSVAIADDQPLVRASLAQMIATLGPYRVVFTSGNALELASAAAHTLPGIALFDARMPNAFHALSQLAGHGQAPRLIVLDEFWFEANRRRALEHQANYATKDATPEQFAEILAHAARVDDLPPISVPQPQSPQRGYLRFDPADKSSPLHLGLTRREQQVLAYIAAGRTLRDCAEALGISRNTAENHKANIMRKLGLHNKAALVRFAVRHGIIDEG